MDRIPALLRRISGQDLILILRIAGLAIAVSFALRILRLDQLLPLLWARRGPVRMLPDSPSRHVLLTRRFVRMFRPAHRSCLPTSLIVFRLLRTAGYPVTFCLGAGRAADGIRAHAWLELGGIPLHESVPPESTYRILYAYPPA